MKTCFALLAVCFFSFAQAQTKERKWDARLALGTGTHPYLQNGGHFLSLNTFSPADEQSVFAAELLYQTKNKKLKLGLSAAIINLKQWYIGGFQWVGYDPSYVISSKHIIAIIPTLNYSYRVKRMSSLYSELSLGSAFTKQIFYNKPSTEQAVHPAFQCTAIGYRFGKRVAVFGELGYGYKGILQFGISGTF